MKIIIHRGTHQIGGIAIELATKATRIIMDMGDELSTDPDFVSAPLHIPGVTDANGPCDAVLFSHYHGDHTGQLMQIRDGVPLYAGALAGDIMLASAENRRTVDAALISRLHSITPFVGGKTLTIGDMQITPWSIDHSACDSYLFLIEAEGKRVLYTGDFRMHGFRGRALEKILRKIGKVDALITEGTTLSRPDAMPATERELQQKAKAYMAQYPYVFVLCASTNLERICALSKAVPEGKYFICDSYQAKLLELVETHWGSFSPLYRNIKKNTYGPNLLEKLKSRGFLMMVRDNRNFRSIISKFDPEQSIILYSMWDGYRARPGSSIPGLLKLAGRWEPLHTSGHAAQAHIRKAIDLTSPGAVIPIHTEDPAALRALCPGVNILLAKDGEAISV